MSEAMPARERAVFRIVIEAPLDDVWRELTRTNVVLPFFFGSILDTKGLAPGNRICMRTGDRKFTGVVGEVLEYDPPRRFSHTFSFTQLDDEPCTVTYDLRAVEGGTEFTLTADKIPAGSKSAKYMTQGGEFIVKTLKAVVEGRPLPVSSKFVLLMCRLSKPFTPKRALSEHWPL